jgi:hypothetical protein
LKKGEILDYVAFVEDALRGRVIEDGDCLIWTGSLSCSAGHPKYKDRPVRRMVWQAKHGELTPKQLVTTTCGNPKCLEHLALTNKSQIAKKTNADPRVKAIKALKSAAIGRARGKLSMEKVRHIRASNQPNQELASLYGVTHGLISKVRTGKAWVECFASPFAGLGAR